jgi:hypothetical protein
MTTAAQDALTLLTASLDDPRWLGEASPVHLDLAVRVWRRARLLGQLAIAAERAGVLEHLPVVARDQLQSAEVTSAAQARAALWELDRVAWALSDLPHVPLVALKGTSYVLAGTLNAAGRLFSDVDLMIPEQHLSAVESRLQATGWVGKELTPYDDLYYRRWTHELPPLRHSERETEVDLHHGILMRTARLKPSSDLLFAAARAVPGSRFKVLAPIDMVLHCTVHLFYGGDLADALRELVDIDLLLRHFSATEPGFWRDFWPRAERLDLARPAFYSLRFANRFLGTPVPEAVMEAADQAGPSRPVLALMDRLVPLGLFPQHPDAPRSTVHVARLLLFVRSHWLKMPPATLARHLAYKAYLRARGTFISPKDTAQ